jgi:hypothetical protein
MNSDINECDEKTLNNSMEYYIPCCGKCLSMSMPLPLIKMAN